MNKAGSEEKTCKTFAFELQYKYAQIFKYVSLNFEIKVTDFYRFKITSHIVNVFQSLSKLSASNNQCSCNFPNLTHTC